MENSDQYYLRPQDLPTWQQRLSLRILNLLGWRLRFKSLPGPHGVVVVYPHTSNWDVFTGLFCKWAIGLPFRWLAKEKLFRGIAGKTIGPVLRSWGAVPVERGTASGAITRLAETMKKSDWFWLALAPEGTRSYKPHWRSGFYHLAVTAKVPLLVVYIDYPRKEWGVVDYLDLTGDQETDMAAIRAVYEGHHGKFPELESKIELAPPRGDDPAGAGRMQA
ncbi:1-acyl-sn-glycerol-3-phosphate acyltransferase [Zemynaea arenosa]|uniref:1-acyl-sn-glycerol-3-phosphate acyltransferase n=1 Tax=Zemynaea arenosa TaxID=2561931 RepID=UPI001E504055|nr:1-acyl-sn-glycerol-3-phosphate acyltransferase [Massilia arenosa]